MAGHGAGHGVQEGQLTGRAVMSRQQTEKAGQKMAGQKKTQKKRGQEREQRQSGQAHGSGCSGQKGTGQAAAGKSTAGQAPAQRSPAKQGSGSRAATGRSGSHAAAVEKQNRRGEQNAGRPQASARDRQPGRQTGAGHRSFAPAGQYRAGHRSAWPVPQELFPPLAPALMAALEVLPQALHRVWPLNAAHRRSLPADVAALSRLLTTERQELQRPYWSSPAAISAYLYYFLPWNLLRLSRLLSALPLPAPHAVAGPEGRALLMDVGSGPLSLPLALWLARPEWRSAPVSVLALDSVARPVALGRELLGVWAELLGAASWPVHIARGGLDSLPRLAQPFLRQGAEARTPAMTGEQTCAGTSAEARAGTTTGTTSQTGAGTGSGTGAGPLRPWLITAANVLNELKPQRSGSGHGRGLEEERAEAGRQGQDADLDSLDDSLWREGPLARRLDSLLGQYAPFLYGQGPRAGGAQPAMLFVEPGTRLGGQTIMRLRELAVEGGLQALAPCGHSAPCSLLAGQGGRTWCHFTFAAQAPQWLETLSAQAGLGKTALSLAPLLLGFPPEKDAGQNGAGVQAAGEAPVSDSRQSSLQTGTEPAGQASDQRNQAEQTEEAEQAGPQGRPCPEKKATAREARQGRLLQARVLSSPFAVPHLRGMARYACTAEGLVLLEDADSLPSGASLPIVLPVDAARDGKSRARIVPAPTGEERQTPRSGKRRPAQATGQADRAQDCVHGDRGHDASRSGDAARAGKRARSGQGRRSQEGGLPEGRSQISSGGPDAGSAGSPNRGRSGAGQTSDADRAHTSRQRTPSGAGARARKKAQTAKP